MRFAVVFGGGAGDALRALARMRQLNDAVCSMRLCGPYGEFCGRVPEAEPMTSPSGMLAVMSGNVYNHAFLGSRDRPLDAVVAQYERDGAPCVRRLCGKFAVVFATADGRLFVARDPIGVQPLFYWRHEGQLGFASERKAAPRGVGRVDAVPPGHCYDGAIDAFHGAGSMTPYCEPTWTAALRASDDYHRRLVAQYMRDALHRRLCTAPYDGGRRAYLFSGGTASTMMVRLANGVDDDFLLHTYAAGFSDAPDLLAARVRATELGTAHHQVLLHTADAVEAVPRVVRLIESSDYVAVATAVPLLLAAERAAADGITVLLCGIGAAETWGRDVAADDADAMLRVTTRAVAHVHATGAWLTSVVGAATGIDVRLPFLDENCVDVAMNITPAQKLPPMHLLRAAGAARSPWSMPMHVGVGVSWTEALALAAEARGFAAPEAWFEAELAAPRNATHPSPPATPAADASQT